MNQRNPGFAAWRMRAAQTLWLVLVLAGPGVRPLFADAVPALQVGNLTITQYELNKGFSWYLGLDKQPRTRQACAEWLPGYLVQLRILAHAQSLGYFNAQEVVREVARMERNMLSSPTLLLPEFILQNYESIPAKQSEAIVLVSRVEVLRETAEPAIGMDPTPASAAIPTHRIVSSEKGLVLSETDCPQGIRDKIHQAGKGERLVETKDRTLVYWVKEDDFRSVDGGEIIRFFPDRGDLSPRRFPKRWQTFVEQHASDYAVNENVLQAYHASLGDKSSPVLAGDLRQQELFSYGQGEARRSVTCGDLQDYCRQLYIKPEITTLDDLRSVLRRYLLDDFTYRTSLGLGVHRQARFQEDKTAYLHTTALEIYTRQAIDPAIDLSDEALGKWHAEHAAAFMQPAYIEVDSYSFGSEQEALAAYRQLNETRNPADLSALEARKSQTRIAYGEDQMSEPLRRRLWGSPEGRLFMPVKYGGAVVVWRKTGHGGEILEPLARVRSSVVRKLRDAARAKLLAQQAAGLAELYPLSWAPGLEIEGVGALTGLVREAPAKPPHDDFAGGNPPPGGMIETKK